jgi:Zn-dependent peptidase ImmA (M78 family)
MSTDRKTLARQALVAALQLRQDKGKGLTDPVCPFDLALDLEIDLWFKSLPSLEGMYSSSPKAAIIIGTERPGARQSYTCAHEIGHHVFGHGTKVDEIKTGIKTDAPFDPEEFLAQAFAGFLLVPKLAVDHSCKKRRMKMDGIQPADLYRLASYFGIGYTTLIRHLHYSLQCLTSRQEQEYSHTPLKDIRAQFGVSDSSKPLTILDKFWTGAAADLEIGDTILVPSACTFEGLCLMQIEALPGGETLYEAVTRGQGRVVSIHCDWSCFVRVRPKKFTGRAIYRHFPEVSDEK